MRPGRPDAELHAVPLFALFNTESLLGAIAGHAGLSALEAVFIAASLAAGAKLFATRVRSSGYSIGYNTSVALFGRTAPYVATWLTDRTGNELAKSSTTNAGLTTRECLAGPRRPWWVSPFPHHSPAHRRTSPATVAASGLPQGQQRRQRYERRDDRVQHQGWRTVLTPAVPAIRNGIRQP